MERSREHDDLAAALAEIRPALRRTFAEELDERVAAGFPRRSRFDGSPLAGLADLVRGLSPQRLLFAGGSAALAAIVIATMIVASVDSGPGPVAIEQHEGIERHAATPPVQAGNASAAQAQSEQGSSGVQFSDRVPLAKRESEFQTNARHREIERSAEIRLLAAPADVAEDSARVFAAVHDADGIVLHSTTSSGRGAAAHFELLIPSAKLGDALAAFSAIDEVQSRHEATDDITEPTVSAREELEDSRARIDALLVQLSSAETETEAEAVETELRAERHHAARLRARLANLDGRTTYSRVSVRIQSDASADSSGAWGFDDALGDTGRILSIAAGVTLVGLAVLTPFALLALLAWLSRRLWLRASRERALDA